MVVQYWGLNSEPTLVPLKILLFREESDSIAQTGLHLDPVSASQVAGIIPVTPFTITDNLTKEISPTT